MNLFLWALFLVVQNAAFTWVSRARNSGSYGYHAVASVCSNGVWFVTNLILITLVTYEGVTKAELIKLGLIYVTATTTGSVIMHWVSINYLEKGKRKVGA